MRSLNLGMETLILAGSGFSGGPIPPHPHLIELSTWPWLERLSRSERRTVTLADVPAGEWDGVALGGFHLVFLMGVGAGAPLAGSLRWPTPRCSPSMDDAVLPGWTPANVAGSPVSVSSATNRTTRLRRLGRASCRTSRTGEPRPSTDPPISCRITPVSTTRGSSSTPTGMFSRRRQPFALLPPTFAR